MKTVCFLRLPALARAVALAAFLLATGVEVRGALSGSLATAPPAATDLTRQAAPPTAASLLFVENVGQLDPSVRFQLRSGSSTFWLAGDALWVSVVEPSGWTRPGLSIDPLRGPEVDGARVDDRRSAHLKLSFPGANPRPVVEPFNRLAAHVSYFLGSDSEKWRAGMPVWGGVRYVDLYPGLDLEVTSERGQFAWRVIGRGAPARESPATNATLDPEIRLRVEGATELRASSTGIDVKTAAGDVHLPLMRRVAPGSDPAAFRGASPFVEGDQVVNPFGVEPEATVKPSASTPVTRSVYAAVLGGAGSDSAVDVAVDQSGGVYLVGNTTTVPFPGMRGAPDQTCGSCDQYSEIFVAKLDAQLKNVAYVTYLGGSRADQAAGIAVDATGAAYVAGWTESTDFPTRNAMQTAISGTSCLDRTKSPPVPAPCPDTVVTKLSAAGDALVFSTYLGGSGLDYPRGIGVGPDSSVIVAGTTTSSDFKVTDGAIGREVPQYASAGFLTRLEPSGAKIAYSTLFGGSAQTDVYAFAVSAGGDAYLTGRTTSTDFPGSPSSPAASVIQPRYGGSAPWIGPYPGDAFVLRVRPVITATAQVLFATYLGGSGNDIGTSIAVDSSGSVYVAGTTNSRDFPVGTRAPQKTCSDCGWVGTPSLECLACGTSTWDAFATKLDSFGRGVYSTYLGVPVSRKLSYFDEQRGVIPKDVAVGPTGTAWIVGTIRHDGDDPVAMPLSTDAFDVTFFGGTEGFLLGFSPEGSRVEFGTYLGGPDDDSIDAVAVSRNGEVIVAGTTDSANFPLVPTNTGWLRIPGAPDSVLIKIDWGTCAGGGTQLPAAPVRAGGPFRIDATDLGSYTNPGNQQPLTRTLGLTMTGTSGATWQATATTLCGGDWLSIGPAAGTLPATAGGAASAYSSSLTVTIDARALKPGNYFGLITLTSPDVGLASPVTATVPITVIEKPVVFVPGIGASSLTYGPSWVPGSSYREIWPNASIYFAPDKHVLSLYPEDNPDPSIIANAPLLGAGLTTPGLVWATSAPIYGPLFDLLTDPAQGGLREYRVTKPESDRTKAGCDLSQRPQQPTFFPFAYDWRKDNAASARKLKDYIECIQLFYPGTMVNIISHSMGGLVTRRYLLDNPDDHHVDSYVSIAAPWLGGPKVVNVLETGDFITNFVVWQEDFKYLARSFTAAFQLLPSRAWYDLGGAAPLARWRPDWGAITFNPGYDAFVQDINERYGRGQFQPGSANQQFHDYSTPRGSQDDWRTDRTGVRYYHLFGQKSIPDTISVTILQQEVKCSWYQLRCTPVAATRLEKTYGDGTVPVLSAQRRGNGLDYNAPNAYLQCFVDPRDARNPEQSRVEHTNITANPEVHKKLLRILATVNQPTTTPALPKQLDASDGSCSNVQSSAATSLVPFYDVVVDGAESIVVRDSAGNSTAVVTGTIRGLVPALTLYQVGDNAQELLLPATEDFTVTFRTITEPLTVRIERSDGAAANQVIRYRDVELSAGLTVTLLLRPAAPDVLRYDPAGDGRTFVAVAPTIAITGTTLDTQPPTVAFNETVRGSTRLITLAASDSGSGVARLLYSLDGRQFQAYAGPITVEPLKTPKVYAFADDQAANRSPVAVHDMSRALTLWGWGENSSGQLGDGTTTNRATPVLAGGVSGMSSVAGCGTWTIALAADGSVWAWGGNYYGWLGDGTEGNRRASPVRVSGLDDVVGIACSHEHSLAVKRDGTVWAWGSNGWGQLGTGGFGGSSTVPVQVKGLADATSVAAGGYHSLAVRRDGSVWTWGLNGYGQLGDGTTNSRGTAAAVPGLSGVTAIAGGWDHSMALKQDGTVWTWGRNDSGQLGNGTDTDRRTPVQVTGLSGVTAIASGNEHGVALTGGGTVWAWGYGLYGQRGDGTTERYRNTPAQVLRLTGVRAIASGQYHSLALLSDGSIWSWGGNLFGKLGDGTATDRSSPVQVRGLTGSAAIAAGVSHSLAIVVSDLPALSPDTVPRVHLPFAAKSFAAGW